MANEMSQVNGADAKTKKVRPKLSFSRYRSQRRLDFH